MSKGQLIIENVKADDEEKWQVHPIPGICVKFRNVQFPSCSIQNEEMSCNKLFVNIAHCIEMLPPKQILSEEEVAQLLETDPNAYKIPICVGHLDKAIDNSGKTATKVDVLVNSNFFHKCINQSEFFKQITINIISETIKSKYGIHIDISGQVILRNKRCMGQLNVQHIRKRPLNSITDLGKNKVEFKECEKSIDIDDLEDSGCKKPRNYKVQIIEGQRMEIKVKVKDAYGNSVDRFDRITIKMNDDRIVVMLDYHQIIADFFLPFQIKDDEAICRFHESTSSITINCSVEWK